MMPLKRCLFVIFLMTVAVGTVRAASEQEEESVDLNALYLQIDDAISKSPQYVAEREH